MQMKKLKLLRSQGLGSALADERVPSAVADMDEAGQLHPVAESVKKDRYSVGSAAWLGMALRKSLVHGLTHDSSRPGESSPQAARRKSLPALKRRHSSADLELDLARPRRTVSEGLLQSGQSSLPADEFLKLGAADLGEDAKDSAAVADQLDSLETSPRRHVHFAEEEGTHRLSHDADRHEGEGLRRRRCGDGSSSCAAARPSIPSIPRM
eukprot:gnl/TRDRNA2_/TRDRNA2_167650_c3_seq2.p1 gnl/TRDRNA2_/TRDRNA2_167650_c3~~gnl/TRDRNA2_/TRDRNA2_167650_c3_seq2.p1  ORF type:complete len:210 (+),score=35.55 gnl/TRDRNA2_/TRDRNA2_167650_c3_seq2:367-996(+)